VLLFPISLFDTFSYYIRCDILFYDIRRGFLPFSMKLEFPLDNFDPLICIFEIFLHLLIAILTINQFSSLFSMLSLLFHFLPNVLNLLSYHSIVLSKLFDHQISFIDRLINWQHVDFIPLLCILLLGVLFRNVFLEVGKLVIFDWWS
jgi:hypothetical protein